MLLHRFKTVLISRVSRWWAAPAHQLHDPHSNSYWRPFSCFKIQKCDTDFCQCPTQLPSQIPESKSWYLFIFCSHFILNWLQLFSMWLKRIKRAIAESQPHIMIYDILPAWDCILKQLFVYSLSSEMYLYFSSWDGIYFILLPLLEAMGNCRKVIKQIGHEKSLRYESREGDWINESNRRRHNNDPCYTLHASCPV